MVSCRGPIIINTGSHLPFIIYPREHYQNPTALGLHELDQLFLDKMMVCHWTGKTHCLYRCWFISQLTWVCLKGWWKYKISVLIQPHHHEVYSRQNRGSKTKFGQLHVIKVLTMADTHHKLLGFHMCVRALEVPVKVFFHSFYKFICIFGLYTWIIACKVIQISTDMRWMIFHGRILNNILHQLNKYFHLDLLQMLTANGVNHLSIAD